MTICVKIWPHASRRRSRPPPGSPRSSSASSSRSSGSTGRSSTCRGGTTCASPPSAPGRCRRPRAGSAFFVEHGLEALDGRRHDRRARLARRPVTGGRRRGRARRTRAARGWCRSAAGSSSSPPRACSTAERRRRTGATRAGSPPGIPRVSVNADVLYVDDGQRADVGGQRRGDRPLPAHRAPRPREHGRQRRRAAAGDPAPPRRRPGAADRAADARASRRRPDRRA